MKLRFKIGAAAILLASGFTAAAQDNAFTGFTKEDMIADFRLAMGILKAQHPHPYKFIDSASYARKVDSLLQRMAGAGNVQECSRYSPIQLIRDVHTSIAYSDDNGRELYSKINFLPLQVIVERGKMLVNIKGEAIPFGAEIVSINQMTVSEMLDAIAGSVYSDGHIQTGIDRVYPDFYLRFSMLNATRKTFDIAYRLPGSNSIRNVTLPYATPQKAFQSKSQAVLPCNLLQRSYFIYRDYNSASETGILTVNSFNLQEPYAYKEFSEFFKEVNKRGYKNVIIDIRNNGGGNPAISALLYSFLSCKPFRNEYNYRTKNTQIAYAEYAIDDYGRKLSEEDIRNTTNFLYQRFDKDSATGFYVGNARLKEGQLENFPPDKNAFSGNVYVLTGGGTVSAATYFASLVQKNKRGMIVGKETGSGEQATTAAWFVKYMLPKTKSVLTVPMSELYFFNATTDSGRGVIPDQEVPLPQFIDFARAGQDPELSYALELISKAGKK
ncbi:S41 family peptidase [Chitinophaga sp. YIM B06452]|uniref:S41 family peptidase n=1 Tax=Chitinophaga sp. YIM B06452 TaxID=3082158 RepID=UPI0031FEBEEC